MGLHPLPAVFEFGAVGGVLLVGDNADDVSVWCEGCAGEIARECSGWLGVSTSGRQQQATRNGFH